MATTPTPTPDPYAAFQQATTPAPAPQSASPKKDPYAMFQAPVGMPDKPVPPTLPSSLPETILSYLPTAGATVATMLAPEVGIPARIGLAALGGAGGSMLKQAGDKALGDPYAMDDFATTTGKDALGQAVGEGTAGIAGAVLHKILGRYINPEQLYQSALRPSPSLGSKRIGQMVDAGLSNGIPVNEAGKQQAREMWNDLNDQITDIINLNPNKKIDPQKIVGGLRDLKVKWSRGSGDPAYIRAIDDVERNFLDQHVDPYNPQLTGPQAQNIKKGLYDEVRRESPQAWSGNPVPIPTQAKQELANALRQELEYAYPTIGKLNQNEGSLIELEKSLDRFISREGNRKILPYLAPLIAVGGGMAGGHPEAGLGTAAAIMGTHFVRTALEDPEVKSRLGIALSQATNSALGRGLAAVAPYAPSLGLRFAGQAAANTQMPPQDVIDSLGPGDHVFRNGISIRKNPDGSVIRLK